VKKRAAVKGQKQEEYPVAISVAMQQLDAAAAAGDERNEEGVAVVRAAHGMVVLSELLAAGAAQIAGPKGKHIEGRTHHHWGTAPRRFPSALVTCRCRILAFSSSRQGPGRRGRAAEHRGIA
jgi:hypothetical protein